MRVIVDEIVRGAQADTTQRDRRHIALGPATLALEMAVLDKVPAGRERLAITARQRNAAITRIKYITANDTMSNAAFYDHAAVADVANEAAGDAVARAVMNFNGTGARGFKSKPAKSDIRNAGEFQQRLGEERKKDFVLLRGCAAARLSTRPCSGWVRRAEDRRALPSRSLFVSGGQK